MNVLSLFDGMSCGQIALNRIGIKPDKYFASEIDKYAIKITQKNYPDTIQIGDVTKVSFKDSVLYTENGNFEVGEIDLLMGGSPCQGFSFAGKQLNFEDERSKLFFEFVRILKECNPTYFLLENVKMKKEYQDVISEYLNVEPILINSALVSAQNRKRLYWTNIKNVNQPIDKHIYLKDILINNDFVIDQDNSNKILIRRRGHGYLPTKNVYVDKINALVTSNYEYFIIKEDYKDLFRIEPSMEKSRRQLIQDCNNTFNRSIEECDGYKSSQPIYINSKKFPALRANAGSVTRGIAIYNDSNKWRKLSVIECERLQTVPDNYTEGVSNTQRYKMLGNGWTVDVICHILKNMVIL